MIILHFNRKNESKMNINKRLKLRKLDLFFVLNSLVTMNVEIIKDGSKLMD